MLGGRIRIPAFQRGFVWDADRVAFFMDSLYKHYPFGSLLLWRTRNRLTSERQLGPYVLPEPDSDYPIDYVLDGQQRLTSIFGVFQNEIEPQSSAEEFDIYFDFRADEDVQESQFYAMPPAEADRDRYFPLRTVFDVLAYREATDALKNDAQALQRVDQMQSRFQEVRLPLQTFETDDQTRVAIVFERVNRLGIELDTLQLLSAWTWTEDFYLQDKFEELAETLEPFGFKLVGEDTNLLLRCCAAVIARDASPAALITLNGAEVRERFQEIQNGIEGAIDFLTRNLDVYSLKNLPYSTLLVPLSVFFAIEGNRQVEYNNAQRLALLKWFWRTCFSRRYSSGVLRNLKEDIERIVKLRDDYDDQVASIPYSVDDFFFFGRFNAGSVNTKTLVLLLAQHQPRSFITGSPIKLAAVLRDYNRNEFHHLYPRGLLLKDEFHTDSINALANFVFMSRTDNNALGGVAPSAYRAHMNEKALPAILESALCPGSLFEDDYVEFLGQRGKLLSDAASKLCETGEV
jgi:hypothetical protein